MVRPFAFLLGLGVFAAAIGCPRGGDSSRTDAGRYARPTQPEEAPPPLPEPEPLPSPGHGPHTPFGRGPERELLLTFDDGPDLKTTPMVMAELDRRGLRGIFFIAGWRLVGTRAEALARRELVRKLTQHGHLVANHTMNHKNLCTLGSDERALEIDGDSELIAASTGLRPLLFRSPYGAFCRDLDADLLARDLTDVGWNIDPQDWKGERDEDQIVDYVVGKLGKLQGRGILLLHDTKAESVRALPRILDWLSRDNHAARSEGRLPIRILDYSVLLPERQIPDTGLEAVAVALADPFRLLPMVRRRDR